MDELQVVLRARQFIREIGQNTVPCSVDGYITHVGGRLKTDSDLGADEAGYSLVANDKLIVVVNANDSNERQRFTACHELGHYILQLPSEHKTAPVWSFRGKPEGERHCDLFAAELLLPYTLFKPQVEQIEFGFSAIQSLAADFEATLSATGSRLAAVAPLPCAFVFSEAGKVRYASRSPRLRDANGWITPRTSIPEDSASFRARAGQQETEPAILEIDDWFERINLDGEFFEAAIHLDKYDQTLTLIWCEDAEETRSGVIRQGKDDDDLLPELDGHLPWPGKSKRKP